MDNEMMGRHIIFSALGGVLAGNSQDYQFGRFAWRHGRFDVRPADIAFVINILAYLECI